MRGRSGLLAGLTALLALVAAGCGPGGDGGAVSAGSADRVHVVTAFYPLQFAAEQVGGPAVQVQNLTKAGAEPHDLELTPRQVTAIGRADLVVYLKGFQPAVDEAVEQGPPAHVLEVTPTMSLRGDDPHGWLDPRRFAATALAVGAALADVDPAGAGTYQANARSLAARLHQLDTGLADGLTSCRLSTFVTSHAAFGYVAERYRLEQVAISGLDPEAEPSPARVEAVARVVRAKGVKTIFFETLVSPKVARTMAADLGVRTAVLDPVEGIADQAKGDYLSVMRANLAALRAALECR